MSYSGELYEKVSILMERSAHNPQGTKQPLGKGAANQTYTSRHMGTYCLCITHFHNVIRLLCSVQRALELDYILWCRALSRRYFCAKEFVSRKKKILKSSLVEMLLLPKGTIPLEDFSIGAILTEFFLWELSNLATY